MNCREKQVQDILSYLYQLKLTNGDSLASTSRKTFIIGFQTAALTLFRVAKHLFQHPGVKYILSFKLTQDPIETLFSKIRSRGGFNNNPDSRNFKAALRAILIKNDISANPNGNSVEVEEEDSGVLSVRLFRKSRVREGTTEESDHPVQPLAPEEILKVPLNKIIGDIVEYIGKQ